MVDDAVLDVKDAMASGEVLHAVRKAVIGCHADIARENRPPLEHWETVLPFTQSRISTVRLAGDINAKNYDDVTLDELLATIKSELVKLGPLIGLDPTSYCYYKARRIDRR
jgi:hypothetical protein